MNKQEKNLCPCGSGKRLKVCCRTISKGRKIALETTALSLSNAGRHAEACEAFERRAALSPHNPMIWNDLGNEYAAAGQLEKAIISLKRAREVDTEFPLPLYNLGVHTLNRCIELQEAKLVSKEEIEERVREAIGYFNAYLERDPDHLGCHQSVAKAYGMVKESRNAGVHMMEALRLTPASERLSNRIFEKAKRLFS